MEADQRAEIEGSEQGRRRPGLNRIGAEEILDDLLQHDGQAEGHEDLFGMAAPVEMLDDAAFHRHADGEHDRNGEQDGQRDRPVDQGFADPLAEPLLDIGYLDLERVAQEVLLGRIFRHIGQVEQPLQRDRAEGADHEQGAMGEIHDPERAEDQRQAERDQRIG